MAASEQDLFDLFGKLGIRFTLYRHAPFFTVEESRKLRQDWPGGHCKCLFLKDKKNKMVLAVVEEDQKVELKALAKTLNLGRFSFCNKERMMRVLGVSPGAVTPFAVMNVKTLKNGETFRVVIDKGLKGFGMVHFHPLHNEATVGIGFPDLIRFIGHFNFTPEIIEIP